MRKKMFIALAVLAAVYVQNTIAQTYVNQVLVLNEGRFDYANNVQAVPVTIGSYNPHTSVYTEFATINNARFATDLVIDGSNFYVAADSFLIQYDLATLQPVNQQVVHGIRKMAIGDGKIVVTRGDYLGPLPSYVQVYDEPTLDFDFEIPGDSTGIPYSTSDLTIINGKAFVAVNNGFSFPFVPVGYVVVLDLASQTITDQIDLGANGLDPENVMVDGDKIYTLNNNDYSLTSISSVDAVNHTSQTTSLALVSGCSSSMNIGSNVFYQSMYDPNSITDRNLGKFSTTLQTTIDTLFMNRTVYGMAEDEVNNLIYVSETDYTSYGLVLVYDLNGNLKDAFAANVSPGTIAFDYKTGTGIENQDVSGAQLLVSPNPFADNISVVTKNVSSDKMSICVVDMLGKTVYSKDCPNPSLNDYYSLDLSAIPSGVYFVRVNQGDHQLVQRIIKQ